LLVHLTKNSRRKTAFPNRAEAEDQGEEGGGGENKVVGVITRPGSKGNTGGLGSARTSKKGGF